MLFPVFRLEKNVIPQSPSKRTSVGQPREGECCASHHLHSILRLKFQKPSLRFRMFLEAS